MKRRRAAHLLAGEKKRGRKERDKKGAKTPRGERRGRERERGGGREGGSTEQNEDNMDKQTKRSKDTAPATIAKPRMMKRKATPPLTMHRATP